MDKQRNAYASLLHFFPLSALTSVRFTIVGTVLSYVFYWLAVILTLVTLKWREGRLRVFGFESAVGRERRLRQASEKSDIHEKVSPPEVAVGQISELPK
jgi:high-affinity iron transporter